MYSQSPAVQALMKAVETDVDEQVLSVSKVVQALELQALAKVQDLMTNAPSPAIQLKAAESILDRGTRATKIQRTVSMGLSIGGEDAKEIARELALSRQVMDTYRGEVQGHWERVEESNDEPATNPSSPQTEV